MVALGGLARRVLWRTTSLIARGLHVTSPRGLHVTSPRGLHVTSPRGLHVTSPRGVAFTPHCLDKSDGRSGPPPRSLSINLLPMRAGQPKPGVQNGPPVLLKLVQDIYHQKYEMSSVADEVLNKEVRKDQFLETFRRNSDKLTKVRPDTFTLNLGGDHTIPLITIPRMVRQYPDLRVIWIDAHADINNPATSPSGNYHGMPVYFISNVSGEGKDKVDINNLVYVGVRDTDPGEDALMEQYSLRNYTKQEIDRRGIGAVVEEVISRLELHSHPVHISLDVDALDPGLVPSTGTLAPGGLSVGDVVGLLEGVRSTGNLVSCDIVELNPELGGAGALETSVRSVRPVLETLLRGLRAPGWGRQH